MLSEQEKLPIDYGLKWALRIYALRLAIVVVIVALNVLVLLLLYWIQGSPNIPSEFHWLSSAGMFIVLFVLLAFAVRNPLTSIVNSFLNAELGHVLHKEDDEEDFDKPTSGAESVEARTKEDKSVRQGNGRGFTGELIFTPSKSYPQSGPVPKEPAELYGRGFDAITGVATISPRAITERTPVTTIHIDRAWEVAVEWFIDAPLASELTGEWAVSVHAEALGPGELKQIGDTMLVPLSSVPPLPLPRRYATTVSVPHFSADPAKGLNVGRYRLVTTILYKKLGIPMEMAAFVEGPIIQVYGEEN